MSTASPTCQPDCRVGAHVPPCPVAGEPLFPSPAMDYALRGPEDLTGPARAEREPAWFPPYFVVGFACGLLTAALAVFVGFVLSFAA